MIESRHTDRQNAEEHDFDALLDGMEYLVIVDLEATCWERKQPDKVSEIIEIGAVRFDLKAKQVVDEFDNFAKPIQYPELSPFCTDLTSITQADVDQAPRFPDALNAFTTWADRGRWRFASWGAYDDKQLARDCELHGIPVPQALSPHLNLKAMFAVKLGRKMCGVKKALNICGLPLTGTHHRGIDDARNISAIAAWLLSRDEGEN